MLAYVISNSKESATNDLPEHPVSRLNLKRVCPRVVKPPPSRSSPSCMIIARSSGEFGAQSVRSSNFVQLQFATKLELQLGSLICVLIKTFLASHVLLWFWESAGSLYQNDFFWLLRRLVPGYPGTLILFPKLSETSETVPPNMLAILFWSIRDQAIGKNGRSSVRVSGYVHTRVPKVRKTW